MNANETPTLNVTFNTIILDKIILDAQAKKEHDKKEHEKTMAILNQLKQGSIFSK